jgi:hypothetical protein
MTNNRSRTSTPVITGTDKALCREIVEYIRQQGGAVTRRKLSAHFKWRFNYSTDVPGVYCEEGKGAVYYRVDDGIADHLYFGDDPADPVPVRPRRNINGRRDPIMPFLITHGVGRMGA